MKAINQQTGAFVEISRQLPPNGDPNFKLFIIRGSPQQIDHAKQLIEEKIEVGLGRGSWSLDPSPVSPPPPQLTLLLLSPGSPLPSWTRPRGTRPCRPHGALQPWAFQSGATWSSSAVSISLSFLGFGTGGCCVGKKCSGPHFHSPPRLSADCTSLRRDPAQPPVF